MMQFEDLTLLQTRIEAQLTRVLPCDSIVPGCLHSAMRYAVLGGGKRLRAILVYATGKLYNVPETKLDDIACAVELIHAYSLIHDDLPAMDDDDLRRGQPSCHKQFDEATAILAGDALQARAFELIANVAHFPAETRLKMVQLLSKAIGSEGMCGGQMLDLEATGRQVDFDALAKIHALKTGYLIQVSILLGGLAAEDLSQTDYDCLADFGLQIGYAFQIQDDILDVEASTEVLGKPQGADTKQGKTTYPKLLGLDQAKQQAGAALQTALEALGKLSKTAQALEALAYHMVQRAF